MILKSVLKNNFYFINARLAELEKENSGGLDLAADYALIYSGIPDQYTFLYTEQSGIFLNFYFLILNVLFFRT